jgi:hypothetical protein
VRKQQHLARIHVLLHAIRSAVAEIEAAQPLSKHDVNVLQREIAAIEALIARQRPENRE